MVGGRQEGFDALYEQVAAAAPGITNLTFHGQVPYHDVNELYSRARIFVNTSDMEGFPNSYLQAWARGTPVVAFFDPDGVIAREGLGRVVGNLAEMRAAVLELLQQPQRWAEASERCRVYMAREYDEDRILRPYLGAMQRMAAQLAGQRRRAMSESESHPAYRADIDGLRAVAVTAVVGFHAFPVWFAGGFIGVDVFFVISGFLITTILIKGLRNASFSFLTFYERRIRRLFPALVVVLVACLALGWFLLYAHEYRELGKHVAGGIGFIDNILYWHEAGYFDTARALKPLLHLWSLGVEEQFYLAWPVLLALCWRRTHHANLLIGLLLAASFVLNVWGVGRHPSATFYLPGARFWELMTGAALAHVLELSPRLLPAGRAVRSATGEALSIAAVVLLGSAFLLIDEHSRFPGVWAVSAHPRRGIVHRRGACRFRESPRTCLSVRPCSSASSAIRCTFGTGHSSHSCPCSAGTRGRAHCVCCWYRPPCCSPGLRTAT